MFTSFPGPYACGSTDEKSKQRRGSTERDPWAQGKAAPSPQSQWSWHPRSLCCQPSSHHPKQGNEMLLPSLCYGTATVPLAPCHCHHPMKHPQPQTCWRWGEERDHTRGDAPGTGWERGTRCPQNAAGTSRSLLPRAALQPFTMYRGHWEQGTAPVGSGQDCHQVRPRLALGAGCVGTPGVGTRCGHRGTRYG